MPASVSALRKLLLVTGSADAGAARLSAVATPTKVTVEYRFALFTETTLVDTSHIDNTVRSPFAHYACPMRRVIESRGSWEPSEKRPLSPRWWPLWGECGQPGCTNAKGNDHDHQQRLTTSS